jgi:hypothetical protein
MEPTNLPGANSTPDFTISDAPSVSEPKLVPPKPLPPPLPSSVEKVDLPSPKKDASYGALVSIVLILAIIVVGAFYVWGQRIDQANTVIQLPDATTTEAAQ